MLHTKTLQIFQHWSVALGRKFKSLKLWFVLRIFGVEGLQKHIRGQIRLANIFKDYVLEDEKFEIVAPVSMGLICFRLKVKRSILINNYFIIYIFLCI